MFARTSSKIKSILSLAAALSAFLLGPVIGVSAHVLDSSLVVDRAPLGPYLLSVWTVVPDPQAAALHVTAQLEEPERGALVLAANMRIIVQDLEAVEQVAVVPARPATPQNGFLFEADVPLPDFGTYRIRIEVEQGSRGLGEAVYIFPVYPLEGWMRVVITGLMVASLAVMGWLLKEGGVIFIGKRSAHGDTG